MSKYVAKVQKVYRHQSGRDSDKTYVHIIHGVKSFGGTFQELLLLEPWNDPTYKDYLVEITKAEFDSIQNRSFPLTWGPANLPKWQWNATTAERGSWADPEDDTSAWQPNVPIPDDRRIVRIWDRPSGDVGAVHLGTEDLVEDSTNVTRFLKLYSQDDVPLTTNAQDQMTEIAGKMMIFSFTNGEAPLIVARDRTGVIEFGTNHEYKVVGPNGETFYQVRIFTPVLRAPVK